MPDSVIDSHIAFTLVLQWISDCMFACVLILSVSVYPARLQTLCGPGACLRSPPCMQHLIQVPGTQHAYQLNEHMLYTSGSCSLKGDDGQCHKSIWHQDSASWGPIQSTPQVSGRAHSPLGVSMMGTQSLFWIIPVPPLAHSPCRWRKSKKEHPIL